MSFLALWQPLPQINWLVPLRRKWVTLELTGSEELIYSGWDKVPWGQWDTLIDVWVIIHHAMCWKLKSQAVRCRTFQNCGEHPCWRKLGQRPFLAWPVSSVRILVWEGMDMPNHLCLPTFGNFGKNFWFWKKLTHLLNDVFTRQMAHFLHMAFIIPWRVELMIERVFVSSWVESHW